jgi:hypothetical protein
MIEEDYRALLMMQKNKLQGIVKRSIHVIEKPLEVFMNNVQCEMPLVWLL